MNKQCNFCPNPLHEIRLGPNRSRLWVHRKQELQSCQAIKMDRDILKDLIRVMHKLGKYGPIQMKRKESGEVVVFGENRES